MLAKSFRAYVLAVGFVMLAPDTRAAAPEYIVDEQPAPASVEDERAPMEEVVPDEVPLPSAFPRLQKRLEEAVPFWRDTQLRLHPRVYYFDRDRENANDSEALAYGGWLAYNSGWWRDRVRLNASVYTTQRAYGPGGKLAASYRSATLTLAFSSTDDGAGIRNPYGGYPGYLSLMIKSFNRADEDAWLVGASYDFARVGVPGLSSFVNYVQGSTPDSGSNASPDQWEFDITVDYRVQSELLNGLWLRARAAFVDQDDDVVGAGDVDDIRFIINYDIPIL
jgi:hypothetical protein